MRYDLSWLFSKKSCQWTTDATCFPFLILKDFQNHIYSHSSQTNKFQCNLCPYNCKSFSKLKVRSSSVVFANRSEHHPCLFSSVTCSIIKANETTNVRNVIINFIKWNISSVTWRRFTNSIFLRSVAEIVSSVRTFWNGYDEAAEVPIFHLVLLFSIRICRIFHHRMEPCLNATKWSRNVSSPARNVPFRQRNSTIWMNMWKANIYNSMILLMSVRSVRTSRTRRPIWKYVDSPLSLDNSNDRLLVFPSVISITTMLVNRIHPCSCRMMLFYPIQTPSNISREDDSQFIALVQIPMWTLPSISEQCGWIYQTYHRETSHGCTWSTLSSFQLSSLAFRWSS